MKRPDFSGIKSEASRLEATLATGDTDIMAANLRAHDLAAPHRAPYAAFRDTVFYGTEDDVERVVEALGEGSVEYEDTVFPALRSRLADADDVRRLDRLTEIYTVTRHAVNDAYEDYRDLSDTLGRARGKYIISDLTKKLTAAKVTLVRALNNLASNAPGLGPHKTMNQPVSDLHHLNTTGDPDEPLTPRSKAAVKALPRYPFAVSMGDKVLTPSGRADVSYLDTDLANPRFRVAKASSTRVFPGSLMPE